jgi:tight adherence protein C
MTPRLLAVAALCGWIGATLVLSRLRWFSRPSLTDRLHIYAPAGRDGVGPAHQQTIGATAGGSLRAVVTPMAVSWGERLARLFGVSEALDVRLRRCHSPLTVAGLRTRQLGWAVAAFGACSLIALTFRLPPAVALLFVLGGPLLAFLMIEQQAQSASSRWQQRLFLELPVVTEQLGMLLSAGYSLGAALNRLSRRSHGAVSQDLEIVSGRIRQGLSEVEALREWADLAQVDALDRLVAVLALNREAGDLGRLITEEARTIRGDAHRRLIETIERRAQAVWIPVTVATLLPGVLFMAVPFIEALQLFTGG